MKPSIGQILWLYPAGHDRSAQPLASLITYVHSDNLINLVFFDQNGNHQAGMHNATSVPLVENAEARDKLSINSFVAMWMPYQVQQAAKEPEKPSVLPEAPNPF